MSIFWSFAIGRYCSRPHTCVLVSKWNYRGQRFVFSLSVSLAHAAATKSMCTETLTSAQICFSKLYYMAVVDLLHHFYETAGEFLSREIAVCWKIPPLQRHCTKCWFYGFLPCFRQLSIILQQHWNYKKKNGKRFIFLPYYYDECTGWPMYSGFCTFHCCLSCTFFSLTICTSFLSGGTFLSPILATIVAFGYDSLFRIIAHTYYSLLIWTKEMWCVWWSDKYHAIINEFGANIIVFVFTHIRFGCVKWDSIWKH